MESFKGTIVLDGALVYQNPDFDAPVIAELRRGAVYTVSKKRFGPFLKILLKPGTMGYISDVDVRGGGRVAQNTEPAPSTEGSPQKGTSKKAKKEPKQKPFLYRRYRGPSIEMISYTENTMGASHTAQMPFYGARWTGYNTVLDGEVYTDASVLFALNAPNYYKDLTGNAASGWILNMHFTFLTPSMQGPGHMAFFGFGPMFKYSHINAQLTNPATSKTLDYVLDDMTLGLVLSAGLGFDIGRYALRSDIKYYIETKSYAAFGLTFQFEF